MITSVSNKEIIEVSKLHQKKHREKTGLFLIEGIKVINEVINNGILPKKIFYVNDLINKIPDRQNIQLCEVNYPVLKKLSEQKNPEGIIAVMDKSSLIFQTQINKIILLDNIRDPGNLGTIIRTADAAGFDKIYCSSNCVDLYNEKTIRGAMGSLFHLPIENNCNLSKEIDLLKDQGFEIIGTSLNGELLYLNDLEIPSKFGLIFGNESHGMNQSLQENCSKLYKLPIFGKAESLNVSVAAGIFMYAFTDQKLH